MAGKVQAVRGMNDTLPQEALYWQFIESTCRDVVAAYGYQEIRFPIVEKTDLFKRSIGDVTDIVEKEMYTFDDRNGDSLTLRPEGTAGCVRAGIQQGLLYNQTQRLWYMGPMFRHERPQKGRYRQFQQFGIEAFGFSGPEIDAELILMSKRMWERLGILDDVSLELNSLGTLKERDAYRRILVDYFQKNLAMLDDDSKRRLETNPLRILDSKNPDMKGLIEKAPKLFDHLGDESRSHFEGLCALLDATGTSYRINPHLVRGLDYYCNTVFEWVTSSLGAQGTVCAGGRYDGLVEQLGGKPTSAIGLAMGFDRLVLLLSAKHRLESQPYCYIVVEQDALYSTALQLAERLRSEQPKAVVLLHAGGGSLKSQFKRADKSNAKMAFIIRESFNTDGLIVVKDLRVEKPQSQMTIESLLKFVSENFA